MVRVFPKVRDFPPSLSVLTTHTTLTAGKISFVVLYNLLKNWGKTEKGTTWVTHYEPSYLISDYFQINGFQKISSKKDNVPSTFAKDSISGQLRIQSFTASYNNRQFADSAQSGSSLCPRGQVTLTPITTM